MDYKRIRKDRDKFIGIPLAADEKEIIAQAARDCDESLSDFCRRVLIRAADNKDNDDAEE